MEFAEQVERLRCIAGGMGDLYSNDEILAVGVGYGIPGALTVEQMAKEADEILADLALAVGKDLIDLVLTAEALRCPHCEGQLGALQRPGAGGDEWRECEDCGNNIYSAQSIA